MTFLPTLIFGICITTMMTSVRADETDSVSATIEKNRLRLCGQMGISCEPEKKLFGSPPIGSIKEDARIELCKNDACREVQMSLPPNPDDLPPRSSVKELQAITLYAKNGKILQWRGEGDYIVSGDQDSKVIDWRGRHYDYEFLIPNEYFWIIGSFYEGGISLLASYRTGQIVPLSGTPQWSPSGRFFFVDETRFDPEMLPEDIADKYFPDDKIGRFVRVYKVADSGLEEVAKFDLVKLRMDRRAESCFWVNDREIAIAGSVLEEGLVTDAVIAEFVEESGQWSWRTK